MPDVVPNNIGIKPMFTVNNPTYTSPTRVNKTKLMLHSTATPGAGASNFFAGWNSANAKCSVEFVVDDTQILQYMPIGDGKSVKSYKTWHCGGSGNNVYIATELCEPIQAQLIPVNYQSIPQARDCKYPRTYATKRIQMELKYRGYYSSTIDGSFGPNTEAAVKKFQSDNGLTSDGIVGMATFYKLRNRTDSYMNYDAVEASDFFNAVYDNAVVLFGFLCNYMGAKPETILCHSEGNKAGVASNHADVLHWFPLHGKSMTDFRNDVAKYVAGTFVPLSLKVSDADQEYYDAVNKVAEAGIIKSPEYWTGIANSDSVNAQYVMALLRQTGAYFCKKSHVYAIDALATPCGLTSPDMWKNSDNYTLVDVRFLFTAIAKALSGSSLQYEESVQMCSDAGIINTPAYWLNLKTGVTPNPDYVRALIRQTGAYLCTTTDHSYAVDAITDAIGMNSPEYWKSTSFSVQNVKFLFKAIAKVL